MTETGECKEHGVYVGSYCSRCLQYRRDEQQALSQVDPFYETPSLASVVSRLVFPHRPMSERSKGDRDGR